MSSSRLPSPLLLLLLLSLPSGSVSFPSSSLSSSPLFPPTSPSIPPQDSGPIPPYVLTYAPLIHLAADELYWPSTIQTHLDHSTIRFTGNGSLVPNQPSDPLTPNNLGFMGNRSDLYCETGVTDEDMKRGEADWLGSRYGIPDERGRSESEVIIILVDKSEIIGPGYLDAFYFTFYSYNEGNTLFDIRFGDHIGDWEHVMIRFLNGDPKQVFLSEHAFGEVWPFDVIGKGGHLAGAKKMGWDERPLVYSAEGSHALYGTPGKHEYLLPFGLLSDTSSPGPLWDPAQNYRSFWLNTSMSTWWTQSLGFVPTDGNDWSASFLDYAGKWGDEFWTSAGRKQVDGQYCYAGNCRYVNGPMGPRYKFLDRRILDPVDFTFDLILAICISLLLAVMVFALLRRVLHPPPTSKPRSPTYFNHLFPFCFFPALSLSPEPIKRRPARGRDRAKTWYPVSTADERTPLL